MSRTDAAKRFQNNIFGANQGNIWNYRQNHPELVVNDCKYYGFTEGQASIVRQSLLVRGINKWLKVRRDLIAYKLQIRSEIKLLHAKVCVLKLETTALFCTKRQVLSGEKSLFDLDAYYRKRTEYISTKERLKLLQNIRRTLKKLCMTDRWQIWEGKNLRKMNTLKAGDRFE